MITAIQKWGNSQGIRIPKHILEGFGVSENEKVDISIVDDKIVIEKVAEPAKKNIVELFSGYQDDYIAEEYSWGESVGKEIW